MLLLAPFSSGASALAARKGNSPPCPPTLTASPHRSAAASCAQPSSPSTKGRRVWPALLQRWRVRAGPLGTLSHQAWKTPCFPILSSTCCLQTASFSWSESCSLPCLRWPVIGGVVTAAPQACFPQAVLSQVPGPAQPGADGGQARRIWWGTAGSLGEGECLAACSPAWVGIVWPGRGIRELVPSRAARVASPL